jgi:hypothetical protein
MIAKRKKSGLSSTALTIFFVTGFLLLVVFGTRTYLSITVSRDKLSRERLISSYLHSISKINETAIYYRNIDNKDVLIIEDGDSSYGNRIYVHEGNLLEDYGQIDSALKPQRASIIAKADEMKIKQVNDELLELEVDGRQIYIHTLKEGVQ